MRDTRTAAVFSCAAVFAVLAAAGACAPPEQTGADADAADEDVAVDDVAEDDEVEGEVDDAAVLEEEVVGTDADGEDDAADPGDIVVADVPVDDTNADTDAAAGGDSATTAAASTTDARAPTAVQRTLRVLQWNIAGGKENACKAPLITRAVRRYVHEHDVDFVSLNEVCPSQYRAIRDALRAEWGKAPGVTFSAYVGDDGGRIVGDAVYSKRRLDVISKLHLGHDQYGQRWMLCGRVAAKKHLRFCSAHLTPGDATARQQLALVRQRLEQWWSDRKDTVILAGDLNITPDDHALDAVYSAAANTAHNRNNRGRYRELDDDDAQQCRGYGERSHAGNGGPCHTGGKIDFIFARENRIVGGDYRGDTLNIPQDCTGACSDHRAEIGTATVRVRLD